MLGGWDDDHGIGSVQPLSNAPKRVALDAFGDAASVTKSIHLFACFGNEARCSSGRRLPTSNFRFLIFPRPATPTESGLRSKRWRAEKRYENTSKSSTRYAGETPTSSES